MLIAMETIMAEIKTLRVLEPKHRFGAEFQISLAIPQLWQVGDTYRIACLSLKKATTYSRDAKVYARDKGKG